MVAITAGDLPDHAAKTLTKDGWKVHSVDAVQNPNMRDDRKYPARFWAVYTKLNVFNLVNYEKGAFLLRTRCTGPCWWTIPLVLCRGAEVRQAQ
jgi:hypothetical protein